MAATYRCAGRLLSAAELQLIVELTRRYRGLSRNELAHTVCELLDWRRPNGGLKTAECRLLLEQLQQRQELALPTLRAGRPRGAATAAAVAESPVGTALVGPLPALQPIRLQPVQTPEQRREWRALIERHHEPVPLSWTPRGEKRYPRTAGSVVRDEPEIGRRWITRYSSLQCYSRV